MLNRVLRQKFRCGRSGLGEENWRPRITAVKNCSNAWGLRKLSFLRRAVVINALALSHIWYVASLLPMDSGEPVVLWYMLEFIIWLSIGGSFVAYCVLHPLVFIGVVKLLFVIGCWPPASLPVPFILFHSAPSVS